VKRWEIGCPVVWISLFTLEIYQPEAELATGRNRLSGELYIMSEEIAGQGSGSAMEKQLLVAGQGPVGDGLETASQGNVTPLNRINEKEADDAVN
jgi:hypothetical protein